MSNLKSHQISSKLKQKVPKGEYLNKENRRLPYQDVQSRTICQQADWTIIKILNLTGA